jgi:hypothetical protein
MCKVFLENLTVMHVVMKFSCNLEIQEMGFWFLHHANEVCSHNAEELSASVFRATELGCGRCFKLCRKSLF